MIDETGNIYGRLTVVRSANKLNKDKRLLWLCKCSCGAEKEVVGRFLRKGHIKSCGCLKREMTRKRYHVAKSVVWGRSSLDNVDEDIIG
jgi:hypothetical protein